MSPNKTYTYTLLHNHLIGMARELRDQTPPRDRTPRMELSALGAIVLAATAVEASLNHAVEQRSLPQPRRMGHGNDNPYLMLAPRGGLDDAGTCP